MDRTGQIPRTRPTGGDLWRASSGVMVFVAGLYLTLELTRRWIYDVEGYVVGQGDCEVTLLLDNIGWPALTVGGYPVLAGLLWWGLRRMARTGRGA